MGPSMTDVSRSMRQQMEENDHSKRKTKQVFFDDMSLLTIGGEIANNILIAHNCYSWLLVAFPCEYCPHSQQDLSPQSVNPV